MMKLEMIEILRKEFKGELYGIWKHKRTKQNYNFICVAARVKTAKPLILYSGPPVPANPTGMWVTDIQRFFTNFKKI